MKRTIKVVKRHNMTLIRKQGNKFLSKDLHYCKDGSSYTTIEKEWIRGPKTFTKSITILSDGKGYHSTTVRCSVWNNTTEKNHILKTIRNIESYGI